MLRAEAATDESGIFLRIRSAGMPSWIVVVSGLPAAGKTTLARRLGRDLTAPVVCRDELKSRVFGEILRRESPPGLIPRAIDNAVTTTASLILDAGIGVIIDGNFNTEQHAEPVRRLVAARSVPTVEVCLWGDPDVLRDRFAARADPPLTEELRPYFESVLHRRRQPVLGPPTPTVNLDATSLDTLEDSYAELLATVRRHLTTRS